MASLTQRLQIAFRIGPTFEQRLYMVQVIGFIQQGFARCAPPLLSRCHTFLHEGRDVGSVPRATRRYFMNRRGSLHFWLEQMLAVLQNLQRSTRVIT